MLPYLTAVFVLLFYFDSLSGALEVCVLRATIKKGRQLFLRKSASG